MLAPYSTTDIKESEQLLKQAIKIAINLKEDKSKKTFIQKNQIVYFLMLICPRITDKKTCRELNEMVKMTNPVFEQIKKYNSEDIALKLKNNGISNDIIMNCTGLTKEELDEL